MSWQPSASIDSLKARAQLNAYIRTFFLQRDVMEVETPILSQANVSDANLKSVVAYCCGQTRYLHTSPEYPMKRLLAAGSGDIYQICKTFRDEEQGSRHNPEFTMLEYYRLGFDLKTLMDEVAQLVGDYLNIQIRIDLDYQQAMIKYAELDPFKISDDELRQTVTQYVGDDLELSRDECLDLVMSYMVEPRLANNSLTFIYHYPASQAALAKTSQDYQGNKIAKRFELYVNGLELANGYHELTDVVEQKKRFDYEQQKSNGESVMQDQFFLQALESGLPECAGVALGLDRILMLKQTTLKISDVMSFCFSKA
jgi:lysyl-tRNA synthetase class 2